MRYVGHLFVVLGAALAALSAVASDWFVVVPADVLVVGTELLPGKLTVIVALWAVLGVLAAVGLRRRALLAAQMTSGLALLGLGLWAWVGAPALMGLPSGWTVEPAAGLWLLMAAGTLMFLGGLRAVVAPVVSVEGEQPLRVALLWKGQILEERLFDEPRTITVGEDLGNTFTVPGDAGLGRMHPLLVADGDRYVLRPDGLAGTLNLGGVEAPVQQVARERGGDVELSGGDWGLLQAGPMALFFQFVTPERMVSAPFWQRMNGNAVAAAAGSAFVHCSLVLAALFLWEETGDVDRRAPFFRELQVAVAYDMEDEPEEKEETDDGEVESESTAEAAEGDEGAVGDPDLDPLLETEVPRNTPVVAVRPIKDATKVGLVNLLANNELGVGMAAILAKPSEGMGDRFAIAFNGASDASELKYGHGSRGMAFKGTGTGGGSHGTFWRVGGDKLAGDGEGHRNVARLKAKAKRRVVEVDVEQGRSAGGCNANDIRRRVRRRATSIRACYEQRLLVKPRLRGRVKVRWTIGLRGRVGSASIVTGQIDSGLTSCLLRVIRRMEFAPPVGGTCVVAYPFLFNPGT